jgi:hypothetical protein
MSLEQLERDVAELRRVVADLQQQVTQLRGAPAALRLTPEEVRDMEPFRKYIRQTGQFPPTGWKPGDPIPEPDEEWCPR